MFSTAKSRSKSAIDQASWQRSLRQRISPVTTFQHRVMGGSSSTEADRIGQDLEEETMTWTILLASISRWTRPMFAFSRRRGGLRGQVGVDGAIDRGRARE